MTTTLPPSNTDLILWDAVDAHGGNGCKHDSDRDQTKKLARNRVSRVLQRQPQTLPNVPITHLLEVLHVSERRQGDKVLPINLRGREGSALARLVFYLFRSDISSTDVSMLLTSLSSSQLRWRLLSSLRSW